MGAPSKLQLVQPLPQDLKAASLQTINLQQLYDGDSREAEKLLSACVNEGFFYLDMEDGSAEIPQLVSEIFALDKELYDLDTEVKLRYDVDKLSDMKLNGYKPVGRNFGGVGGGKKDGFETYTLPKDGIMGLKDPSFDRPPVVDKYMSTLRGFTQAVNLATSTILSSLSDSLDLPQGRGFEDFHRPSVASPDIIRLLKYHAQPIEERGASHTPHTDLGSLTFLFTRQPGLQVLDPKANEWVWVQPRANHAIVNLGDGMSTLTNNYFHSCLHRVGPLPGIAMEERYSFAYLVRAEDSTPMTGLESALIPAADSEKEVYTSGEWLQRKFGTLRLNTRKDNEDWVLTGRQQALPT